MKVAMGVLAVARDRSAASCSIPKATTWLDTFLEPTFAGLDASTAHPSDALLVARPGPRRGARPRAASSSPTASGCGGPGTSARVRERVQRPAPALRQQVVLRRADRPRSSSARPRGSGAWASRRSSASSSTGTLVGGTSGIVRAGSAAVRAAAVRLPARVRGAARRRRRRRRPLLPASRAPDVHLSILLWLPLAAATVGLAAAGRGGRCAGVAGRGRARSRSRSSRVVRLQDRRGGPAVRHRRDVDPRARHPLQARRRRAEPLPRSCSTTVLFLGERGLGVARASGSGPGCSSSGSALAETAVLGALLAQDLALFVVFFDLMLVPFFFLTGIVGRRRTACAAIIKLVHLHARRLAAHARGGDRDRRAARRATASLTFALSRPRRARALPARLAGLDLPVLRRRVPREDAGVPAARLDARRLPRDAAAGARRLLRRAVARSPPTASCASCCRCSPTRARTSRS